MRAFLAERVGPAQPWPPVRDIAVAPSRLSDVVLAELSAAVPDLRTDDASRLARAAGASFSDYARLRDGDASTAPDAVAVPTTHDQVLALLQACGRLGVPVVTVGGGTSVVGGITTGQPHVALAMDAMAAVEAIDPVSCLVRVGPGITGPRLEPILAARGLTLGHLPQSWERATIGGYAATRSAGQSSTGYGRSDEMVEALRLATPIGTWDIGRTPATAAGPDLLGVAVGSEGALGVITEVTLRVRHLPAETRYEAAVFPDVLAGMAAFRELAQAGLTSDVMRLSDEEETTTSMLMSAPAGAAGAALKRYLAARGVPGTGALAIVGWEGTAIGARRTPAWRILRRHGAVSLGTRPGASWLRHRFEGPYLRDRLMDAGYLVETVETATSWANLADLRSAVHGALHDALAPGRDVTGPGPYVMSHVSHVYETGASLYTTVVAVADRSDPVGQWRAAKVAVTDAMVGAGATITHHHAVGRDHAPWLPAEVGEVGIALLRALKERVDPAGILNPGVLVAPDSVAPDSVAPDSGPTDDAHVN